MSNRGHTERRKSGHRGSREPTPGSARRASERPDRTASFEPSEGHRTRGDMPRWRRIEIMREREQLRDALGGIDLGPDLLDDDIFGFEDAEDHYLQDEDESMYAPESDFGLDDAFGVPEEEWPEDD